MQQKVDLAPSWEPMKITDIIFEASTGKYPKRIFDPKEDITPMEQVRLLQLFTFAALASANRGFLQYDYHEFIERHALERHFKQE